MLKYELCVTSCCAKNWYNEIKRTFVALLSIAMFFACALSALNFKKKFFLSN